MNNQKILAIIQVRMGSSRLPNKVLMPILNKPVLWHIANRLQYSKKIDEILIATSNQNQDNKIEKFCKENSISVFRGDEVDVLDRFYKAAKEKNPNYVVRITGDCPLIDPLIIDELIAFFLNGNYDFCGIATGAGVANQKNIGKFPDGLDAEIFKMSVLEKAWKEATESLHREHVTPFIWSQPKTFKLGSFINKNGNYGNLRLTLDNKEDFKLIKWIYNKLYKETMPFELKDVFELLKNNPNKIDINSHLVGKEGYDAFWQ